MKKYVLAPMILLVLCLSACAPKEQVVTPPLALDKVGIAPFEFTTRENQLFQAFGVENDFALFLFKAPTEAKTLRIQTHTLKEDGSWDTQEVTNVFPGKEFADKPFEGSIAMRFEDDESFKLITSSFGRFICTVPGTSLDLKDTGWCRQFLSAFQVIELNKEIPIAMSVYSKGNFYSRDLSDFFTPEKISVGDNVYVRVLTISFSDVVDPAIEQTKASPPQ